MMLLWCLSKFAQLYKLSLFNEINIQPFLVEYRQYCTLGSEYLPQPSASGNTPNLSAIFIDNPRERVEYLLASERSERDTIRGVQIRAVAVYINIYYIACKMDQSDRFVGVDYLSIFHPNNPPLVYWACVATDTTLQNLYHEVY